MSYFGLYVLSGRRLSLNVNVLTYIHIAHIRVAMLLVHQQPNFFCLLFNKQSEYKVFYKLMGWLTQLLNTRIRWIPNSVCIEYVHIKETNQWLVVVNAVSILWPVNRADTFSAHFLEDETVRLSRIAAMVSN